MTANGGIEARWRGDLPDDLLGEIYRRCSSSYDRARFAAVCRSWRAAASWQPKLPALPLLLPWTNNQSLDRKARVYSPEDRRVLRARLPGLPYGRRIVGSHDGGWVAASFGCWVDVVNLFTRAWVVKKGQIVCRCPNAPQPADKMLIEKIVFSEDPATEGCILAAITHGCPLTTSLIALCRLGGPHGGWTTQGCGLHHPSLFRDIAFCNGELYGLSSYGNLFCKFGIGPNEDNAPVFISLVQLTIQTPESFYPRYMFELHGKLATVEEIEPLSNHKARRFRVFDLTNNNNTESYKYTWAEVTSLGDHALFVGQGCCKAVRVSTSSMRGEVEQNRIYYYTEQYHPEDGVDPEFLDSLDLGSCDILCCFKNKGVHHLERITSRGYHYREKFDFIFHRIGCRWIFPPQF